MKWRLSCFIVVISLLVVLLSPSVTTLRGSTPAVDDQSPSTARSLSRGSSRFGQKRFTEDASQFSTTSSTSANRRVGSSARRSSRLQGSSLESTTKAAGLDSRKLNGRIINVAGIKPEDVVLDDDFTKGKNNARRNTENLKNDRRYLPDRRNRVRSEKSFADDTELETPKISRSRIANVDKNDKTLNEDGPSVFSSNVQSSRSRTGRKIQNPGALVENEKIRTDSRRWKSIAADPEIGDEDVNADPAETKSLDNVRLDIPLSIDEAKAHPSASSTTESAVVESRTTRGRSRSRQSLNSDKQLSESSTMTTGRSDTRRSGSRSSKSEDESNSRIISRSKNDRSNKSRVPEVEGDAVGENSGTRGGRGSRGRKPKAEEDSRSPIRPRNRESGIAETRPRSSSRSSSRSSALKSRTETTTTTTSSPAVEIVTEGEIVTKIVDLEPTVLPETETVTTATTPIAATFQKIESTTKIIENSRNSRGKSRSDTETKSSHREDYSSRRRSSATDGNNESRGRNRAASTISTTDFINKEGIAPNQRRRFANSRPREELAKEEAVKNVRDDEVVLKKVSKIEESEVSTSSTISLKEKIPKRRGLKRLNIRPKDDSEELSTASSIKSVETLNETGGRRRSSSGRGGKTNRKSEINVAKKTSTEISEDDNYPADFKARLAQLKNSEPKVSPRTAPKSSSGIGGIQNLKKPLPITYSTNARSKIEKEKKINVKQDVNSDENAYAAVEQTSVSPSTSPAPNNSPRKSLFGKRPKLTQISGVKLSNGRTTSFGNNRPSFGKNRKTENTEASTENSATLESKNEEFEKINENFRTRSTKQRPNFSKRRSVQPSTTENVVVTSSESSRPDENSVSKYVRGGRFSLNNSEKVVKPQAVRRLNERSTSLPEVELVESTNPVTTSKPFARYTRRKSDPTKTFRKFDPIPRTSEEPETSVPTKREFRPRTATYRRHSEAPSPLASISPVTNTGSISIDITPKTPQFHATFNSGSSSPRNVNVQVSDSSSNDAGISGSSNGESGNKNTNVFSPTRSLFLINRNTTLLEQLRSTVAPLLSSLGLKSPVFAGAYRNGTSSGNSAIRVTPSGQPPRFSARYKGAELFVRRPNVYQPTLPSTVGSTTPLTPLKVFGVSSPLDVTSPDEPKVLTYYQALETASINNEQQTDLETPTRVGQVDNDNDNDNVRDINDTNIANIDIISRLRDLETGFDVSENSITTQDPVTTTVDSIDSDETVPSNSPQLDNNVETTQNPRNTFEDATESVQTAPNEATSQSFDILSTTLETFTNSNPDTTVAFNTEESSSPQSNEPFQSLIDTTTVSLMSTTTSFESTLRQGNFSESLREFTTTQGSDDVFSTSTPAASSDVQTTQISEFIQIEMQFGNGTSRILSPASLNLESVSGTESSEMNPTTNSDAETPQTPNPIFARFLDSETLDPTTTVASSTQEPTTPFNMEINPTFEVTTDVSQVTNELDTESPTQIITTDSKNVPLELEMVRETSTQSDITTTTTQNRDASSTTIADNEFSQFVTESSTFENVETLTTVAPETTTDRRTENTTPEITQNDITSVLNVTAMSVEESVTQTTQSLLSSESTTTLSETVDSFDISSRLGEITATQEPILTTNKVPSAEMSLGSTELTTNPSILNEVTTDTIPETSTTTSPEFTTPNFVTDTTTLFARLQDLTAATTATATATVNAQGTAGDDVQTTTRPDETTSETTTTTILFSTQSSVNPMSDSIFPDTITTTTSSSLSDSNEPAATIGSVQTSDDLMATTEEILAATQMSTLIPETTMEPMSAATTTAMPETTFGIDENLIFANSETTEAPTETISTEGNDGTSAPSTTTTTTTRTTTVAESSTTPSVSSTTVTNAPELRVNFVSTTESSIVGRFGGNRLTPAPRFSSSSSTRTPLRDYHVYGIYPNKTIVRKRPEDNLIDGRNVNSPYVIFGIYPDGKLVRKFPNGTVIPDPPRNPVEVVFSLSTTTTNRPSPVFYNQANQGYYNKISPIYNNRPVASIFNQNRNPFSDVNIGFNGNTITGINGGVLSGLSSVGIANNKMSDVLLRTQMGTSLNTPSEISDLLTTSPNSNNGAGSTPTSLIIGGDANSNTQNGGRISQEKESDEASRNRQANGQSSSVYIGQEKFINYWTDNNTPNTSPRVLSVRINSVASSSNVGPDSSVRSSLPSFDILPGSEPAGTVTTAPGSPWRDPLDQIFGITTSSPSASTNTISENPGVATIQPRPINPFVEVFTPVSSTIDTTFTSSTTTTTTTTTPEPTTTTTTTTTPEPTTTTTTTTTTTPAPTTTTSTTTSLPPTTTTTTTTTTTALGLPEETPFGNTFNDLAFLNSLLQPADSGSSTQKTLSQAEQLLANKILELFPLALGNAGPTRSPKAIRPSNASPNSFDLSADSKPGSSRPIIINLLPSSTSEKPVTANQKTTQFTWKPIPVVKTTPKTVTQVTWKPIPIVQTTSKPVTTSRPVTTTKKLTTPPPTTTTTTTSTTTTTTTRPRTTTPPPNQGFAAGLLTALFGSNPFAPAPAPAAKVVKKVVTTTEKPVQTTAELLLMTTKKLDPVLSDSSRILATSQPPQVTNGITVLLNNPNPRLPSVAATSTFSPEEDAKFLEALLKNPKPRVPSVAASSTFSPEEDAKFLEALLSTVSKSGKSTATAPSSSSSSDDEAFLRAILSGKAQLEPASPIAAGTSGGKDAALLAALLQAEGIGPVTPADINIRNKLFSTTQKPVATTARIPRTSTYPSSIFDALSNLGSQQQGSREIPVLAIGGEDEEGSVRSQVVGAAIGATKAFSRFLGAAITGAAQQFQSFVRNGTRIVSEAVG